MAAAGLLTAAAGLLFLGGPCFAATGHQHINAGASGSAPGAQLYFVNGDRFTAESGYVVPLAWIDTGPQAGHHRGSITFTALAATPDYGGPAFDHAALGAHLEMVVETVTGPVGGRFGFWEGAGEGEGEDLTFEVPVGTTQGTGVIPLTETENDVGADPYGHFHGRVFSATTAGLYTVGFRIVDTSSNGPDGGPLHPPSELFLLHFQAGVTIDRLELTEDTVNIRFAAVTGFSYQLEQREALDSQGVWSVVGDPVAGDDHLHMVTLPRSGAARYFRLHRTAI